MTAGWWRRLAAVALLMVAAPVEAAQAPGSQAGTEAQGNGASQAGRRTMVAVPLEEGETIVLDGRLDEAVWSRAVPATDFIQQDPDNGQPATEQTEVRIVYTRHALYMGVICYDSEPDRLLGYQRRRDEFLGADDRFMWTIDTFLDGRTAYFFEMNPSGLMADALRGVGGVNNRQWDGIWDARARRSEIGWTLEIEIPFATLSFNPDSDTWGINFQRTVRRKNEESLWMGWARNQGLNRMTNAGLLTGIRNVSQGLGLDIKPYVTATSQASPGRGAPRATNAADVGIDLFYNLTPGLRANLTVNTDFAQTEVDQRQVNLTRFSLFFPERRDFFLDGSPFYSFASGTGQNSEPTPFFSRQIGLDAGGAPQKIDVGAKLMGQVGDYDVGVLHVRTGEEAATPGEDFTVLRLRQRMLQQSYVGAIYTRRAGRALDGPDRHTTGVDFRFATASFRGSDNLGATGYYLHSTNPLDTGRNAAYGLAIEYPNDPWSAELRFREVQEAYDAAIGFTPRRGFRRFNPQLTFSPRPSGHPYIRRFMFGSEMDWFMHPDGNRTLTRMFDITALRVDLHSQDWFQIQVRPTYERLERNFNISPGVTLPVGTDYGFLRYRVQANTASRRTLSVAPTLEWGGFFSGDRLQLGLNFNVRARPGLMFFLTSEWNRVELAEGRFYTRLYRGIADTQFSPWIALVNTVQYDTQSGVLGWQSRFRWILKPGNDLYLVYTHNWQDDPVGDRLLTLDRRMASKLLYTLRF